MSDSPTHIAGCAPHLAQGDIFRLRLVAPLADDEIRIFRTASGEHGGAVFDGESGQVYSYDDLLAALDRLPSDRRLLPFSRTRDGLQEMVVVYADLLDYFVVASQTCDVSGVDGSPKHFGCIVPFIPLATYLARERLPIGLKDNGGQDISRWTTIAGYLEATRRVDFRTARDDPFALPGVVRKVLADWNPAKGPAEKAVRGQIKSALDAAVSNSKAYTYYLPPAPEREVPEGFLDFCRLHTLAVDDLRGMMPARIAAIAAPYREEFAQKLALYLSRIATPAPLKAPSI